MSRNTALVTDAAQLQAQSDLDDYAAGIAAHLGGDWGGHRQMNIAFGSYSSTAGVLSSQLARMQLNDDLGATVVVCAPAFFVSSVPIVTTPVIVIQPQSMTVEAGGSALFRVYAASPLEMTYQWQFKDADALVYSVIAGATASTYVIPQVIAANAGQYRVTVANATGSITSVGATLTVA